MPTATVLLVSRLPDGVSETRICGGDRMVTSRAPAHACLVASQKTRSNHASTSIDGGRLTEKSVLLSAADFDALISELATLRQAVEGAAAPGSVVTVSDRSGRTWEYELVQHHEPYVERQKIALGSPMAKALLGARSGDHIQRVGVGYDGGPPARGALACAVDLVRLAGGAVARLHVVYVDGRDEPSDEPDVAGLRSSRNAMIEWWLDSLNDDVPALVRPLRLEGDPAEALADLSQDLDLLVVGTRRRGWLRRLIAGSISTRLLGKTRCALLVLPDRLA